MDLSLSTGGPKENPFSHSVGGLCRKDSANCLGSNSSDSSPVGKTTWVHKVILRGKSFPEVGGSGVHEVERLNLKGVLRVGGKKGR